MFSILKEQTVDMTKQLAVIAKQLRLEIGRRMKPNVRKILLSNLIIFTSITIRRVNTFEWNSCDDYGNHAADAHTKRERRTLKFGHTELNVDRFGRQRVSHAFYLIVSFHTSLVAENRSSTYRVNNGSMATIFANRF